MYQKIKEAIDREIVEAKKEALQFAHMEKYSEVNGGDGCNEFNCQMNAEDSITEYKKILNFVERCEDDWHWLIGNCKESGVGKSNWGTLNYPNKENPITAEKVIPVNTDFTHFKDFTK